MDLDREFAYTGHRESCRDAYGVDASGEPVYCRRARDHEPPHAAGYGADRVMWGDDA